MRAIFTFSEEELRQLIHDHLNEKLGDVALRKELILIEVKSKQNYKSEWEVADFRARYEGDI